MATVAENSGAPPDPQVAGGGGKPPGKRGGGGRKNPPPDRQQDTPCQYCGEYDHTTDEHFERTLQNAINALVSNTLDTMQSVRVNQLTCQVDWAASEPPSVWPEEKAAE